MRFVCCITKATDTHWDYVLLIAFLRLEWLRERALLLRYTYIAYLVARYIQILQFYAEWRIFAVLTARFYHHPDESISLLPFQYYNPLYAQVFQVVFSLQIFSANSLCVFRFSPSIVTRLRAGRPTNRRTIFNGNKKRLFSKASRPGLGPTQPGVKRSGR